MKRQKVAWLLVEQELVDADIAIKTALSSQVATYSTIKIDREESISNKKLYEAIIYFVSLIVKFRFFSQDIINTLINSVISFFRSGSGFLKVCLQNFYLQDIPK